MAGLLFVTACLSLVVLTHAQDCVSTGVKCVSSCHGVPDGNYQSCHTCHGFVQCSNGRLYNQPCPTNLSWDDSVKQCVTTSTTCKHCLLYSNEVSFQDAGEQFAEALRLNAIPKQKTCNNGTGPRCVSDCTGKKDGDYQSCHGCDVYVSCVAGNRYDDRPCAPGGLVWDDDKKRCEWTSPTCKGCAYTKPCKGTGPWCITSCGSLPDGDYQSCKGCDIYASCSNGNLYDKRPCAPGGTVWDDDKKLCDWYSNTCHKC